MPLLNAIVTCKGRLEHLKQSLPALMALPDCEVVVVDYDCPDRAGEWVRGAYPAARVVQLTDRPFFALAKARNAGARLATAPWLFFADADAIVAPQLTEAVRPHLQPGVFLWGAAEGPDLSGTKIVAREDFIALGGYDEVFEGYAGEDTDLAERLKWRGVRPRAFPPGLLRSIAHDDASRGRYHANPDARADQRGNALYRNAKTDLLRHGVEMDEPARRRLYQDLHAAVRSADGYAPAQIRLREQVFADRILTVSLRYEWRRPD